MKRKKIFWGTFFILAALIVVISKLGAMPHIGVFSILATAFFVWVFAEGIRRKNFYSIIFSVAFICIIFDKQLKIEELTPWTILAAALFLSIGLSMVFGGKKKKKKGIKQGWNEKEFGNSENCSTEYIYCENHFGAAIRYINSNNFCGANLENHFGVMTIYFDNAIIQKASAYVDLENHFGETVLYIPKEWRVQKDLRHTFGNVDEHGVSIGNSSAVLYIRGETDFGNIIIHYI